MSWLRLMVASVALAGVGASGALASGATQTESRSGTISWVMRHDMRGESLAAAHLNVRSLVGSHWQPVRFARVLRPDPASDARVVVSLIGKRGLNMCLTVFVGRRASFGGCAVGQTLRPISATRASHLRGVTGEVVAGLARDGVSRVELMDSAGRRHRVSLKDNALFVRVIGASAVKLVAYDSRGLAVGVTRL